MGRKIRYRRQSVSRILVRSTALQEECTPWRPKRKNLAASGTLHPTSAKGPDHLCLSQAFFDPADALQVKYEMLRRVARAGRSVTQATKDFGFSRRHFYDLQHQFAAQGFQGLVPKQRGPTGVHKLTAEVVDFLDKAREDIPGPKAAELARRVHEHCERSVHPRSIAKAFTRQKKARTSCAPRRVPSAPRQSW